MTKWYPKIKKHANVNMSAYINGFNILGNDMRAKTITTHIGEPCRQWTALHHRRAYTHAHTNTSTGLGDVRAFHMHKQMDSKRTTHELKCERTL